MPEKIQLGGLENIFPNGISEKLSTKHLTYSPLAVPIKLTTSPSILEKDGYWNKYIQ
uniref:Uncharacterized protein n=1 Tax=uncultured bacterium A1Q1_fos_4 TaxID=1256574 RepID=L7W0B3_9BACT|nr:hypothetical protein [uncultured bacterium A1Q1_fos_4]